MTDMRIKYWGVRGSIPAPLTTEEVREKELAVVKALIQDPLFRKNVKNFEVVLQKPEPDQKAILDNALEDAENFIKKQPLSVSGTYGGNTTCIEVQAKYSPLIVIDAGTGIRGLGQSLVGKLFSGEPFNPLNRKTETFRENKELNLFFTHYHWDHLQGFPFFGPGFIPGDLKANINFYGKKDARQRLSEVLAGQQRHPNFPIEWVDMPCNKEYTELGRMESEVITLGAAEVKYTELNHPDVVLGYSIEVNGKKFVVATDTEPRKDNDVRLVKLAKDADIMYYDGQYTPEELRDPNMPRQGWGHGTFKDAIDTAIEAGVKKLVLGHHEPARNDFELEKVQKRAEFYLQGALAKTAFPEDALTVEMAYEGMVHEL